MERNALSKLAFFTLTASVMAASQGVLAHTRLQTKATSEATVYNNVAIGHGCGTKPVIANSVVFPDGTDSKVTIVELDGAGEPIGEYGPLPDGKTLNDYINWGGQIKRIPDKSIFEKGSAKWGRAGVGGGALVGVNSWQGILPGLNNVGLVPLRIDAAAIVRDSQAIDDQGNPVVDGNGNPVLETVESCAKSVTFEVAIADICTITKVAGINDSTANLWTPAVGSIFDGVQGVSHGYNSPATFTINRKDAVPPTCGNGYALKVQPSADQLNKDLPIPGVWPAK